MFKLLTGSGPCPCCAYSQAATAFPFARHSAWPLGVRFKSSVSVAAADPSALFLDGGTVIDPSTGDGLPRTGIAISHGRILSVISGDTRGPQTGAERIDLTGKFVVPGYNDMHSHVLELADPSGSLALMLAEGVTGFRQMSGSPGLLAKRKTGTLPIGEAAPQLLQTSGSILTPFNAGSPEIVRNEVRRQKSQGADFIKMGFASTEAFFAALEEGRKLGIPVLGHLQEGTDPVEATAAGFRSIEHLGPGSTVWVRCSTDEDQLRAESYERSIIKAPPFKIPFLERLIMRKFQTMLVNPSAFAKPADVDRLDRAIGSFSHEKAVDMAGRFASHASWQCPTLVRLRTQMLADDAEYERDEMLRYLPAKSAKRWREVTAKWKALPDAMRRTFHQAYPRQLELTKLLSDSGVLFIVGTDGGSYLGPGLTLRQEFAELANAGIAPLVILQMATVNAAKYLGRSVTMGTVETGKDADLVILDADPRKDVGNLHRIAGVVRGGRYFSRSALDALAARVQTHHGILN